MLIEIEYALFSCYEIKRAPILAGGDIVVPNRIISKLDGKSCNLMVNALPVNHENWS